MKIIIKENQLRLLTENVEEDRTNKIYALCFKRISEDLNYEKVDRDTYINSVHNFSPMWVDIMINLYGIYDANVSDNIDWENDDLLSNDDISVRYNDEIEFLPKNLIRIEGDLDLYKCHNFKALPNKLSYVKNSVDLDSTLIENLPPNLINFNYHLDLKNTKIKKLPDNLRVNSSLDLRYCENFNEIPKNLHVGTYLYLGGPPISKRQSDKFGTFLIDRTGKITKI